MRRFLYITPYFPPLSRTGALRPLKFARHLPACGWAPVVLCDLWSSAATDTTLADAIPETTVVVRRYSSRAATLEAGLTETKGAVGGGADAWRAKAKKTPWHSRLAPAWLSSPELLPLGEHSLRIPFALREARKVLAAHPCEAILVNADPYAATLVGARLGRETGLPLLIDLRDPWAVCELRRPRRPALIRGIVDRMERRVVEAAARTILNTRNARDDYRAHYGDLDPARFTFIRNHADAALIGEGSHPGFDRYSLLFLGNFGRFVPASVLLDVLGELRDRGVGQQDLQLVVAGHLGAADWKAAEARGVSGMIHLHPHVPYRQIGAFMQACDLLVVQVHPERQRLAAKFYDYLASDRPILAISSNPEQAELLTSTGAGVMYGYTQIAAMADHIQAQMAQGRQQKAPRNTATETSDAASKRLAAILDEVTRGS